jgi:DNA-binding NarL/FixJ family response regulator
MLHGFAVQCRHRLNDSVTAVVQFERVRILIVDDCDPWRRAVSFLLTDSDNIQIVGESSDGLDAVHQAEQLRPDVVLLDIELPKLNGLSAARSIRKVCPDTRILFLSSYQGVKMMQEALRVGDGFVVKADAPRDLLPILQAVIRKEPFLRFRFLRRTDDHLDNSG